MLPILSLHHTYIHTTIIHVAKTNMKTNKNLHNMILVLYF